ncbi:Protein RICE SALT SENSITIVE 3 [Linum perenne]
MHRILVWEDGFCNFATAAAGESSSSVYGSEFQGHYHQHQHQGLQPELFFKMSHEIYNYGEGLIGKVAADHSHKWIYKEPNEQEINFLSAWHNSADSQPRTWEAQFQSGIKTIALIAVREGVVQLGAINKVIEDLSYVVLLRKKFSYIESIPGVLLPHPSSASCPPSTSILPFRIDPFGNPILPPPPHYYHGGGPEFYEAPPPYNSLEALLSKLPSVVPPKEEETTTTTEEDRRRRHCRRHDDVAAAGESSSSAEFQLHLNCSAAANNGYFE